MKSINLPFRTDIPLSDQCSHGKAWTEYCVECDVVNLGTDIDFMERQLKRTKARLADIHRSLASPPTSKGVE
jgi:hypothetical protein